jgi:cytochrome P450
MTDGFDLRSLPSSFYEDPYPIYHALRAVNPVRRMPDGSYFLTRYADCAAVYRDAKTFSSDKKVEFRPKYGNTPLFEHHTTSLVFNDPPLHTRVRRLIMGALTVRAIEAMERALTELVDQLLDAAAIPVEIIGNLLAIPRTERGPLRGWSLAILGALEPVPSADQLARGNRAVIEFTTYLRGLVAERRKQPGNPTNDVLTRLIAGEGNERSDETELLQNCIFILNAGHETTTNLIGNALFTLLVWPTERERLRKRPEQIRAAVEEFLRFESSNQLGNRITVEDTELAGRRLSRGTPVTICIGAANRDPAVFPDPDRLDIGRYPNRHLAFGLGVHQCAGLSLARLEGRVAISRFIARFPDYQLAGKPVRGGRARFRGFLSVPVRLR